MVDGSIGANDRVTLARIDGKIDMILQRLDAVCGQVNDHETRIRDNERWKTISVRNWERHDGEHEDEWEAHNNVHNLERGVTGGLGVAITAVLSWLQLK